MNKTLYIQLKKLRNMFETENIIITGDIEDNALTRNEYAGIRTHLRKEKKDGEYEISNHVSLSLRNGGAHIHIY